MIEPASICLLEDFGVLRIGGADARKFLQGQLSNDVGNLRRDQLQRTGLHNPQGRTLALLAMLTTADDSILALVPRELLSTVHSLLKRYVLRSKVSLSDDSDAFRVYGIAATPAAVIRDAGACARYAAGADPRLVLLQPASAQPLQATMPRERWRAFDIAAGLPQIRAITSGQFVAQMLNLDCIDAVSFSKGCYTGQEIIARAHYRGRVKRRMQRFLTESPQGLHTGLSAGGSGRLSDGRHYQVVEATVRDDGRCEFLAVAHLPANAHDPQSLDDTATAAATPLAVQALPLPYPLPD